MADVCKFVETTISLLNLEREAEIEETKALRENTKPSELQKKGVCLLKLRIRSRCTGLYGRTLLSFERKNPGGLTVSNLPAHSFTPGDIAGLSWSGGNRNTTELSSGIVTRVTQAVITVAFDETSDTLSVDEDGPFQLTKLANDITYRRTKSALNDLAKQKGGPLAHLVDVLFGHTELGTRLELQPFGTDESGYALFNSSLDESQRVAVQFALSQPEVAVIHGPPGTGKTTTVVEVILQAVKHFDMKVLACAPSNVAVDNMVERLAHGNARVVRLGHPARLLADIQKHSLDAILSASDATAIVHDVRREIDSTLIKVRKSKEPAAKKQLRQEVKFLRKELRQREDNAMKEILKNADVILVTTTSASSEGPLKHLPDNHFGLVVIDEVAQALEASCWIPLLRAGRCVLAGDHHQLPPTILSHKAAKEGLAVSLMERVVELYGESVVHMLTTQYRMHQSIMHWSSQQLYEGRLTAHESVQSHLLRDLTGVRETEDTSLALLLIDTAGCDVSELDLEEEVSRGNEGEADIVTAHVTALVDAGLNPSDVAVISPYNLQVELLRLRLLTKYPALEIKSVDGFQGREKEAVIISLVRSNKKGEVGFLAEERRINVAITRARRHLAVVADSETVGRHPFLGSLLDYMSQEGEVRSAVEYQGGVVVGDTDNLAEGAENFLPRKTDLVDRDAAPLLPSSSQIETKRNNYKGEECEIQATVKRKSNSSKTVEKPDVLTRIEHRHNAAAGQNSSSKNLDGNPKPVPTDFSSSNSTQETVIHKLLTREELEKEIRVFLIDKSREELTFPSTLSAQERFLVHSIAEEVGVLHESTGDGKKRHIIVRKVTKQAEKDDDLLSTCPDCNKRLPTCNLQLHRLRCEQQRQPRPQVNHSRPTAATSGCGKPTKDIKKKKSPSLSTAKASKETQSEDDFDAMISSFTKLDSECAFERCIQSVRTLGQKCACCLHTYCLSHHIPEVHGCGAKAKIRARQSMAAESSRLKTKKVNAAQKAHLQRKLDKKMDEMAAKRKPKKKEEKK